MNRISILLLLLMLVRVSNSAALAQEEHAGKKHLYVTNLQERLEADSADRLRYAGGGEHPIYQAKFNAAVRKYAAQSPESSEPTGPLDPSNFKATLASWKSIRPSGELLKPPAVQVDEQCQAARIDVEQVWDVLRSELRESGELSPGIVQAFRDAVSAWKRSIEVQQNISARDRWLLARAAADLKVLGARLADPERQAQLHEFLRNKGFSYEGSAAGLLEFMAQRRLAVQPGSAAQAILAKLGNSIESAASADRERAISATQATAEARHRLREERSAAKRSAVGAPPVWNVLWPGQLWQWHWVSRFIRTPSRAYPVWRTTYTYGFPW